MHADVFNVANTLPNMLYILLAGGVFNAVLVPAAGPRDAQRPGPGDAYTSRVVTVAALFLVAVTVVLVVAAPADRRPRRPPAYDGAVRDSAVAFTRFCLPQVFFYGMYVLVGQILNARGSFGPMMWAPIANNVIAVTVVLDLHRRLRQGRGRRGVRSATAPGRRRCSASARRSASRCSC